MRLQKGEIPADLNDDDPTGAADEEEV